MKRIYNLGRQMMRDGFHADLRGLYWTCQDYILKTENTQRK